MIRNYFVALFIMPLYLLAQKKDGIIFEKDLSWKEIQAKALDLNRYIFVDCYTTWCSPCRKMDEEVYPDSSVGDFMNKYYVCVKVQMDTTGHDDPEKMRWYPDAHNLMVQGRVRAFPTYLFFSPKGELLHFGVGAKDTAAFVELAKNAMNPSTQYFTLLKQYRQGELSNKEFTTILKFTEDLQDDSLSRRIAKDYLNLVVYRKQDSCFTKADLFMMWRYVDSSDEKGFKYFYSHSKRVDSIMGIGGMSIRMIDRILRLEEIEPWLKTRISESKWRDIYKSIVRKYNQEIADRILFSSKLGYYSQVKDWKHFALCFDEEIKKYPPKKGNKKYGGLLDDAWELNSNAWLLFLYCNQAKILSFGLKWSDAALRIDPDDIQIYDTKANLLYKMGQKEQGIEEEELALAKAECGGKGTQVFVKEYEAIISKMKSNQATW